MNAAHVHLVITHFPFVGSLFGLGLLLLSSIRGNYDIKRLSFWTFLLSGVIALPTYLTGRPANNILSQFTPGMATDLCEQHAEVAVIALTAALLMGASSILALFLQR